MANLNVENLSKIVQTGDVEKLFGSQLQVSEEKMTRELQAAGVSTNDPGSAGKGFSDMLRESVDKVNTYQHQADTAIKELISGRNKNVHETMLLVERADTSLKLMMQVRNKVLDAYKEIMRMQV